MLLIGHAIKCLHLLVAMSGCLKCGFGGGGPRVQVRGLE